MKALSVKQPWAGLIALGYKKIECRTWGTNYRGPLLICASKSFDRNAFMNFDNVSFHSIKKTAGKMTTITGKALCIVELYQISIGYADAETMKENKKDACCDIYPETCLWRLKDVERIKPFDIKGQLSLFNVDETLINENKYQPKDKYKTLNSEITENGMYVDCSECRFGYNGNKECKYHYVKQSGYYGCFNGEILDKYKKYFEK